MIYKIITDFQEDLDKILKHFQTEFVLLFYNNVVYIANKSEIAVNVLSPPDKD